VKLHKCKVCGKPHQPGKDGSAKGLCARCYKRDQRGLPPAPRLTQRSEPNHEFSLSLPESMAKRVRKHAGARGASGFIRAAIQELLAREGA